MLQVISTFAQQLAPLFTAAGVLIAAATFVKAVAEFVHQNTVRRFDKFREMSTRFDGNPDIQEICLLLQRGGEELAGVERHRKEVFICFFEEIALMVNSGVMKKDVALYTFGYYAARCCRSAPFWSNLDENESFYRVFVEFCRTSVTFEGELGSRRDVAFRF